MAPKNKKSTSKKTEKSVKTSKPDEDWDSILDEFGDASSTQVVENTQVESTPPISSTPKEDDDEAAAYLESLGLSNEVSSTDKKKDKKKRKGKKKGVATNEEENTEESKKPLSQAAKVLLERQSSLKAHQELLEQERLEQERLEKEEEMRIQEEERKKQELLQKKKDAKKAKIEKQKKEGTYMTKAEKLKAQKTKAALEQLKAAGLVPAVESIDKKKTKKVNPTNNTNTNNTTTNKKSLEKQEAQVQLKKKEVEEEVQQQKVEEEDIAESWDDWEANDLVAKIQQVEISEASEDEDLLVIEQRKEQERLRLQGLALKKKEEEEARLASNSDSEEDSEDEYRPKSKTQQEAELRKREAALRRKEREDKAMSEVSLDNLRSPICCIMGHVDTGKTKLLDNIRRTNVQDGEAGGITQQIGATFFPKEAIVTKTARLNELLQLEYKLPGLLVIDTPGHESFTNLRSRGSSLCDIAILVVDIMHGLEPQTLESLKLLKQKRAPFVVALNKVDRCYGWKTCTDMPIREALAHQNEHVLREFESRTKEMKVQFAEQGLNAELYWENHDLGRTVSFIPTSAISGEGVQDLLLMLTKLTTERMAQSLAYVDILQCSVLEVKVIEGLGTTIDTILVNGSLKEGDTIVVCTLEGPVVTTIRSLLTPHPMKEIRIKGDYIHHASIKAAMGVKICAQGLEKAVAGTAIYVVGKDDDVAELKDEVMSDLTSILDSVKASKRGVIVQASTLGALEALLEFLRTCSPPIPVSGVNIGPVHKRDVVRASVQLEHQVEFATILAFDVRVQQDAMELANDSGVRIFTADIIYHLFDQFTAYMDNIKAERRAKYQELAQFPVILKILPNFIFNKKDPIIFGVDVEDGILKIGTLLVIPSLNISVGRVTSIEKDHKEVNLAKKGSSVSVKIQNESNVAYGRHFTHEHKLYSKLTRESIDALKENFKDDLSTDDWRLVIRLKKVFDII